MSLRPQRRLVALVCLPAQGLAALDTVAWAGAEPAQALDPIATMARITRDLDLQTQMPNAFTPPKDQPWSGFHWHIPADVAEWILLGALVIGFGFAAYALRDTLPGLSRRTRAKPDTAIVLPNAEAVERMHETGDEADELARRGLLAEAMHMLLLRSLSELRKRLTIADSLTSREILQRLALPELGRAALADLIQRVEAVHFGRRVAASADYGACRESYRRLIGAMAMPPAAG